MAESHVLSGLKSRREEIVKEIRHLSETLAHLNATIKYFDGPEQICPKQRNLSRDVFQAMREIGKPMTSREIANIVQAPMKRVMGTLCYQRDRGRVKSQRTATGDLLWEIA